MSHHPYRQKVNNSTPYPVQDFLDSDSTRNVDKDLPKIEDLEDVTLEYDSQIYHSNESSSEGNFISSPTAEMAESQANNLSGTHKAALYPGHEIENSPGVYSPPTGIASPTSNNLSSSSSLNNFNFHASGPMSANINANGIHAFSKSENHLPTQQTVEGGISPVNREHNRSVSSVSSFNYDNKDNVSMIDFSHNILQQYLGDNSNNLLPRIKTIELYRMNAKKSTDPNVLFQYAQYMLQTALLMDSEPLSPVTSDGSPANISNENISDTKSMYKLRSVSSSTFSLKKSSKPIMDEKSLQIENEKKLKRSLMKEAITYLKKLSDKGYIDAQYLLADAYSSGALRKVDNRYAFALFQSAAKHGHVESAYRTSYCFENGLGTGRDSRKALEYLKMAAAKNHPASMYKLGVYSFYGRMGFSNSINTKKSGIKWLTRASNVANELTAAAPYELGKIYYEGFKDIVIADKKYALELYAQAAALGHIQSAAILGKCYEFGDMVPQDPNLSIHYYTQAALGGHPDSMLAMCAWYLVGNEPYLSKDESEAFEWAKRAANCSLPRAQFALANFYEKGVGCIKNESEAQVWFQKAAENGHIKSISRLKNKDLAKKIEKKQKVLRKKSPENDSSDQDPEKDCIIT